MTTDQLTGPVKIKIGRSIDRMQISVFSYL